MLKNDLMPIPLFHEVGIESGFSGPGSKYIVSRKHYIDFVRALSNCNFKSPCITFDDGGKSNLDAVEIAIQYGVSVKIFVPTMFVGMRNFLSREDLIELNKLKQVEIGSHSVNHPNYFNALSKKQQLYELSESKKYLEDVIQKDVGIFSIPGGVASHSAISTAGLIYNETYSSWQSGLLSSSSIPRVSIESKNIIRLTNAMKEGRIDYLNAITGDVKLMLLSVASVVFPALFKKSAKSVAPK